MIPGRAGENDGLVSAKSQVWGEVIERISLSHNQQHFSSEAPDLFLRISDFLGHRGL